MNKRSWITLGGVIVIAILAIVFYKTMQPKNDTATTPANNSSSLEAQTNTPPVANTNEADQTNTAGGKLSYTAAVKKYGANRIQFDATCQAHPNAMSVKNGTVLMLDNRGSVSRKIVFNGKTYTIAALDYTVVTASATTFPKEVLVDCGTSQNVARITINR